MLGEVTPDSTWRIYQSLLEQAAEAGRGLLLRAIAAARVSMQQEAARMESQFGFEQLQLGVKLLAQQAPNLTDRFVVGLSDRFKRHIDTQSCVDDFLSFGIHLDQLEQMDELQVRVQVETTRALQQMMRLVEEPLAELTNCVGALFGLRHMASDHNVLRPESYLDELQHLIRDLPVPAEVHLIWLVPMSLSLGEGLGRLYPQWTADLRKKGVEVTDPSGPLVPEISATAGFTENATPADGSARRVWTPAYRETILTLDRLRQLMAGQLESTAAASAPRSVESLESCQPAISGFQKTLPAALNALQEMHQLDEVVQRMRGKAAPDDGADPATALRESLIQQASSMSQVLSLEVVSMMLDHLVRDPRLLAQVRRVLGRMEPALLKLVLVDPRFFVDKQHPARRLLDEISQKGMAFCSVDEPDYGLFIRSLHRHLGVLFNAEIPNSEPFETALTGLLSEWDDPAARAAVSSQIESAVDHWRVFLEVWDEGKDAVAHF